MSAVDIAAGIVVNALGGLDNPNAAASLAASSKLAATAADLTVDARCLRDAHASGATAILVTVGYVAGDAEPWPHTLEEIRTWDAILAARPDDLTPVRRAADIEAAKARGRVGIIYGMQNAAAVEDDPERVGELARLGVRAVQLTYNGANRLGGGAMAAGDPALTPLGRQVVERLEDARLMVDLSHSGERTCLDALAAARRPVSINHTGCRALSDLPRNKTDEELRLVAEGGGFVGIYFMPFLRPDGHPAPDDVAAHVAHAVRVCGEDHVGIGTDGLFTAIDDMTGYRRRLAGHMAERRAAGVAATGEAPGVVPFVPGLEGPDQLRTLAALLDRRGFATGRIEKILGANFLAFARAVWGG